MRSVFLSCVSKQFKSSRAAARGLVEDLDIRFSVQEDFESTASPHGTLVKIYEHLKGVDLVVQLIGSHASEPAPKLVVEELYRHDPNLRKWMLRMALNDPADGSALGYTDWEAYIALYLDRPFLPLFFENGTQPAHVVRLKRLGRHVEQKNGSIDALPAIVSQALALAKSSERDTRQRANQNSEMLRDSYLLISVLFLLSIATVVQLNAASSIPGLSLDRPFQTVGVAIACWAAYVLIQVSAMSEKMLFPFKVRVALRTATLFYFVSVLVASIFVIGNEPNGYWATVGVGCALLGFVIKGDTKHLEEELSARASGKISGVERGVHYYWTRRSEIFAVINKNELET